MSVDLLQRNVANRFGKIIFADMRIDDLDEVMSIEERVHAHPWTRGNFLDSLSSGYQTIIMRDQAHRLLGYCLVMLAVDEAHLLNISVDADVQGLGCGQLLLHQAQTIARKHDMRSLLLEVRVSSMRTLNIYRRYGFVEIGRRKNYYLADQNMREDAIVMSLSL